MKIVVIGSGYVGLVAGACFADVGNSVYCVDINQKKIEDLNKGIIPIYEPGLDELVKKGVKEGRLFFTTSYNDALAKADVVFMAVGTPPLPNGEPDLSYLKSASEKVAQAMTGYVIVVNKSTVPIGSHKVVADWMAPHTKIPFDVVSNPEFLKEGSALDDFLKPDRVVIGTDKEAVFQKMQELYAPFVRQGNPVIWMDPVSAEITKYACNAFLATRISFMNELALLCEKTGGDVEKVRKGMSTDVRIGKHFLYAGVGYGGSCFPKDVQALMATGRKNDMTLEVVTAAEEANAKQKKYMAEKVIKHFGGNVSGKTFGIWGLAFKPNTDDMREAPSLVIINDLIKAGAKIKAFDPVATEAASKILENKIIYARTPYEAIEGCDAMIIATEWNEFRQPDFSKIKSGLKNPVIFDGRNIFDPKQLKNLGFTYFGVGRS